VDGTLIEAWASQKSFRPKDGSADDDDGANFHGNPPVRTAFRAATLPAIVCRLICKQMSKREQGFGSVGSGATTTVDDDREASDR
jgi:hypothetical protein